MSVELILSAVSSYVTVPVEKLLPNVAHDILEALKQLDDEADISDTTLQNIQLLKALLQHEVKHVGSNAHKHSTGRLAIGVKTGVVFRVWECIMQRCITRSQSSRVPQIILEFLVSSVLYCNIEEKQEYTNQLKQIVSTIGETDEKQKYSCRCQNILSLVETFLQNDNESLTLLRSSLMIQLVDIVIYAGESIIESPLLIRLTGIMVSGLKLMQDEITFKKVWNATYKALIDRGISFVHALSRMNFPATENSCSLQYCLVLMDFLLELIHKGTSQENINGIDQGQSTDNKGCLQQLLCHPVHWRIIQCGLCHKNAYSRKQALYDLKRSISALEKCRLQIGSFLTTNEEHDIIFSKKNGSAPVFYWDSRSKDQQLLLWNDFLLIAETLEENQLHVINPVLKRLDVLIDSACIKEDDTDKICIHTSWVCTLLRRMLSHESKAVIQEGVIRSLQLDASVFPFLKQETGLDFLCSTSGEGLIPALQDLNLYSDFKDNRAPISSQPELPKIAKMFQHFLQKCMTACCDKSEFFHFILESISRLNWGPIPLYYVCSALSQLPEVPVWSSEELQLVRSLMSGCLRTHDTRLRISIRCLILKSMTSFTDCSKVSLDEVLSIILLCNVKDLIHGSALLFNKISTWLVQNLWNFCDVSVEKLKNDMTRFVLLKLEIYVNSTSMNRNDRSCNDYLKEAQPCALLVLLLLQGLHTMKVILRYCFQTDLNSSELFKQILMQICRVTDKASTHLYLPTEKVYRVISLLNNIVTWFEFEMFEARETLWNQLFKIAQGLIPYIAMHFPSRCSNFEESGLCFDTTRKLLMCMANLNVKQNWKYELCRKLAPMIDASRSVYFHSKVTQASDVHAVLISVKCLSWTCSLLQHESGFKIPQDSMSLLNEFMASLDLCGKRLQRPLNYDETWGKIVEEYVNLQWSVVPYAIQIQNQSMRTEVLLNPLNAIRDFLQVLDIVTEENIHIYFNALGHLIPEILKSDDPEGESLICESLDVAWRITGSSAHSPTFWIIYKSFIEATIQKSTLSLPASSQVQQKLTDLLSEIVNLSCAKPGLLQHASHACIKTWLPSARNVNDQTNSDSFVPNLASDFNAKIYILDKEKQLHERTDNKPLRKVDSDFVKYHTNFVVQCLTFCPSLNKEDLALCNVLKLVDLQDNKQSGSAHFSIHNVSIATISMLLELDEESPEDCLLGNLVFKNLLLVDESLTQRKARYHHNSVHHHMKNKVYQAVILLLRFVPKNEGKSVIEFVVNHLKNDNQPSVRYLMEWTLALLLFKFPSCDKLLFSQLCGCDSEEGLPESPSGSAKFSAVCSYLTSALLLGLCRMQTSFEEEYFLQLLNICFPWCMSQHFSIRLYALAVVLRIKNIFDDSGKTHILLNKQPALLSCLLFADMSSGNVALNWIRMKDNFFLFELDPLLDLSVETLYSCLPRLCGTPQYVTPQELQKSLQRISTVQDNYTFRTGISLFNNRDKLRKRTSTKWIPQESKQTEVVLNSTDRYRKNYGSDMEQGNDSNNVQKKIMPWLDAMEEASDRDSGMNVRRKGLVLVASLIDKPSNLGGLTRTCEIFGAEALVVQSMSCTSDKVYQSLSVTAHKWVPMKEVKPWQLEEYLGKMRRDGYTLIGTEQTAQSMCLSKYRFPEKCVVVLGNEKEGIPIPILKILDVCVQIPQTGIVRSLNVHVSGAITIWEYARQGILRSSEI